LSSDPGPEGSPPSFRENLPPSFTEQNGSPLCADIQFYFGGEAVDPNSTSVVTTRKPRPRTDAAAFRCEAAAARSPGSFPLRVRLSRCAKRRPVGLLEVRETVGLVSRRTLIACNRHSTGSRTDRVAGWGPIRFRLQGRNAHCSQPAIRSGKAHSFTLGFGLEQPLP
jgi:hypothetical protein